MVGMDLRIVFMGSPDFSLPTLTALTQMFNVVGVVTQPDRPAGRGRKIQSPPVKILAQTFGLPVLQPISLKNPEAVEQIQALSPEVIVVAAFGQILKQNILQMPTYGCINVHASLLPRWRGAAPVQAAVLHDEVSGVTIMKMDQGLDTGPILSQRSTPITDEMTAGMLFDRLAQMGADLLVETLPGYVYGEISPRPQEEAQATYAPQLRKEDGKLDFNQPAAFLARQVRAYNPWPGSFADFDGAMLKIFRAHAVVHAHAIPGRHYIVDSKPAWGTQEGLLVLDEVQAAGKSRMGGDVFLHGTRDWIEEEEAKDE
ncbi:MAG: methionyl-tRNA formyltransferase [Brevefilum sp.]|nr:methionyl-tRNA formyltransferase [Brevefilum sp.]